MIYIHYRASDGEIQCFENSPEPTKHDGCETTTLPCIPDPKTQKIDTVTLQLVDKIARAPDLSDVQSAIARQLLDTDQFMVPDRPLATEVRAAWTAYRQALRDLSKLDGPAAMLEAWPKRPDGADPLAYLIKP